MSDTFTDIIGIQRQYEKEIYISFSCMKSDIKILRKELKIESYVKICHDQMEFIWGIQNDSI